MSAREENMSGDPLWRQHWVGMPEFVMGDESPRRSLRVHFRSEADVEDFARLLGQRITPKQKSLWHPESKPRITSDKHYVDES